MGRQRQRNKDGGPIRSVFYLRMSTDKQDLSIGGQRYQLLQFVESDESNDRVVVGEYIDEGTSGSTSSRANFQRMMADATGPNPPFDEVITYDLSRFSRDTVDSLTYPRILQAHGIGFHSFKDNFSSDASGRLHMTLIAGVNEFHNYKTAEGSSRGQADATRMGYYTGQRAPLGFLKERVTVGGKEHSILVIEPEKAPLVQRIFGLALQGQTPMDIAKTLNAEGIPSSTGNTWSASSITTMLHNVRYAGTGCHGKRSHSKFLFNSTVTLVPNAHPGIVSQETFDKVQEILTSRWFSPSDPESKHPRRAASPFLLSNLVYCKCCGKKMFVRNSGKDRRKLACSTNRTRGAGACPTRPENMEAVETTVLRALLKKVLTEKNLRQVVQKVGEESKNFAERQDRECETINVKLEDIKTQKNNIIQAIAREGRHIPDLATYLDGLSQEQAGLEARKVGLDTERNELQAFLSDELRIIENASRVRTYLQSEERSVVMSMIESFVKKVELNNGSVTIHYSIPMPPGGNGKKVGSETLPLNGDQWPMETPSPEGQEHDSLYRAPYVARLAEFVTQFATTRDRVDLIEKFLDYRDALHQAGISEGFPWINGGFVENIEQSSRRRPPEDIDVVTFFFRDESAREGYEDLFDPDITKQNFDVDGYGIELGRPLAVVTAMDIGYFHGMWSHRRVDHVWKGFIQVDLDPEEDPPAQDRLRAIKEDLEKGCLAGDDGGRGKLGAEELYVQRPAGTGNPQGQAWRGGMGCLPPEPGRQRAPLLPVQRSRRHNVGDPGVRGRFQVAH